MTLPISIDPNFQHTCDAKTGLSAVYDASKMAIEEVKFDFKKYDLNLVETLPQADKLEAGKIYLKPSEKGLEVTLLDTDGKPVAPYSILCKALDLTEEKCKSLTQDAFAKKHSEAKNAQTLQDNILKELFVSGHIIKPFNLKFYKITPKDTTQTPFLLALNHAKSGSAPKDGPPRTRERKEINRISTLLQNEHPDCTHLVWAGDSNEPAYKLKEGIEEGTTSDDLEINKEGLTNEALEIGGTNLVATDVATPEIIIAKARIVGARTNPQTDKGGETGNAKLSAKSRAMVFKFKKPEASNADNVNAIQSILDKLEVPKGDILALHSGKTFGSDHGKTTVVNVNGIALDVQPLLETSGPRGFHSHEGLYKAPYDDKSIEIEQKSGLKLTELILLAMGKSVEEIQALFFKEREKIIHPDKKKKDYAPNSLVEELSVDWKKQATPPTLYTVLKGWITSDAQKAANDLLSKTPELAKEEDIEKAFDEYFKKKDGRILDAIFRAEQIELSAGFTYLPNPRLSQLKGYDSIIGRVDLRLAAGDGPNNHDNYENDMLKICARLNGLSSMPANLWEKAQSFTASLEKALATTTTAIKDAEAVLKKLKAAATETEKAEAEVTILKANEKSARERLQELEKQMKDYANKERALNAVRSRSAKIIASVAVALISVSALSATALTLGAATPVVLAIGLGSSAVLALATVGVTLWKKSRAQAEATRPTTASTDAPSQTAETAVANVAPANKAPVTFSNGATATPTPALSVTAPVETNEATAKAKIA